MVEGPCGVIIVEENLVVNKGELLLYYDYSNAVFGMVLLGYMHVPNLVAIRGAKSVRGSCSTLYSGINTPLPPKTDDGKGSIDDKAATTQRSTGGSGGKGSIVGSQQFFCIAM